MPSIKFPYDLKKKCNVPEAFKLKGQVLSNLQYVSDKLVYGANDFSEYKLFDGELLSDYLEKLIGNPTYRKGKIILEIFNHSERF